MAFTSPPDPAAFDARVYRVVCAIPPGRVMTYGQIAELVGRPAGVAARTYAGVAARWVGAAMARAPDFVPWQRVINSQGRISPRPGRGPDEQRRLLEAEGVEFSARGRVDLERFGHHGRQ
ncbi:MAG TPA: MGMT family protein [Candidatus Saccharimonadales bacterium]|nr:MGMT family protein [Candidatus Saccharimonadales bacterium]